MTASPGNEKSQLHRMDSGEVAECCDLEQRLQDLPRSRISNEHIVLGNNDAAYSTGNCTPYSSEFSSSFTVNKPTILSHEHITSVQDLIQDLATALIGNGFPSHRLEKTMSSLGASLGLPTTFYHLNTHSMLSFKPLTNRGPPVVYPIDKRGSMNFTKLPPLFELVKRLIRKPVRSVAEVNVTEISGELERIEAEKPAFNEWHIAASYIVSATTAAIMFFSGNWHDALVSGALAIIPAGMLIGANRCDSSVWWTYECITCFLVSFVATYLSKHFCYSTLILSAPVTLLPGYTITIAIVEIMTKNIIAGCIRLCYTVVYLTCMVLGFTLAPIVINAPGNTSGVGFERFPRDMAGVCGERVGVMVDKRWLLLCVPAYICAYNVYLKAPYRQWPAMIVIGSLGYGAAFSAKHVWHAPPEFNGFVASLAIGLSANLYTRLTDKISFTGIVAGVFVQVPGSWGIRGLLMLAYGDYDKGLYWCYSMLAICVSISLALLLSNHLIFGFKLLNRGCLHLDF